jgi:acyl-CoA thioester hydrolase
LYQILNHNNMLIHHHQIRVRYAETDAMKYVYYGNYAQYFEVARVEVFRSLGYSYLYLEQQGVLMPVSTYQIKYIKPAFYDDLLTIETAIKEIPGVKITFDYQIFNQAKQLITTASTTLFFLDAQTQKIIKCPDFLLDEIKKHFGSMLNTVGGQI